MKTCIRTTVQTTDDENAILIYDTAKMSAEEATEDFISKGCLAEHFLCSVCGQDFGASQHNAERCCAEIKRIVTDSNPVNLRFTA